jgi:hypothetical protein
MGDTCRTNEIWKIYIPYNLSGRNHLVIIGADESIILKLNLREIGCEEVN